MTMKRIIWTVIFRDSSTSPQQELVRYTEQAANTFARLVQDNGGVAIIIEGDEDTPDDDSFIPRNPGALTW